MTSWYFSDNSINRLEYKLSEFLKRVVIKELIALSHAQSGSMSGVITYTLIIVYK